MSIHYPLDIHLRQPSSYLDYCTFLANLPHNSPIYNPSSTMAPLVWLITGTTSGIGAALLDHIIAHGDQVIASGRNVEKRLGHLKSDNLAVLDLDITAGWAEIEAQVKKAWEIFGHIDVLMNNAGVSAMRTAEEAEYVLYLLPILNDPSTSYQRCSKFSERKSDLRVVMHSSATCSKPTSSGICTSRRPSCHTSVPRVAAASASRHPAPPGPPSHSCHTTRRPKRH